MLNSLGLPMVSVLMLTYNHEEFIGTALDSVIFQDFENFEIICGDDFSTDSTRAILRQYEQKYKCLKVIYNEKNMGIVAGFNTCLQQCRGKYICLLAGDDLYMPAKISEQVKYMENNPEVYISYHDVMVFSSSSNKYLYNYSNRYKQFEGGAFTLIQNGAFCPASSVMVRNENLPLYDHRVKDAADWLWYVEILLRHNNSRIGFIPGVFGCYRRHEQNVTTKLNDYPLEGLNQVLTSLDIIVDKFPEFSALVVKVKSERMFVYALKILFKCNLPKAIYIFYHAMLLDYRAPIYAFARRFKVNW